MHRRSRHRSSDNAAVADKNQIEEAAANDPTKAGKIEFFMQYVYPTITESHPMFTH